MLTFPALQMYLPGHVQSSYSNIINTMYNKYRQSYYVIEYLYTNTLHIKSLTLLMWILRTLKHRKPFCCGAHVKILQHTYKYNE